jgi:hypothetical protein
MRHYFCCAFLLGLGQRGRYILKSGEMLVDIGFGVLD